MDSPHIMILGIGNILFSDEGFGIRVIEKLMDLYEFSGNISFVDGGVLGMNLLGIISEADHLIVVDVVRNGGKPGTMVRLEGDGIPARIRAKNSLHQVDFLEALTMCQVFDKVPQTVILGVEPQDIDTLKDELTPSVQAKVEPMIEVVLEEICRRGVTCRKKNN
ncbi:MAG: HyaD/HybD family hydrogenase maturation endopeptidase [Thermodesulfobacteriota bacterium]|jgi:hydrogenase maturation protease